jgi:hypothetical protein
MAEKLWIEMMFLLGPNEIFGFMMFFDDFQPTEPVQNKKWGFGSCQWPQSKDLVHWS